MFSESTRKPTRPTRPRYLPRHMRSPQNGNDAFLDTGAPELTRSRFYSPQPVQSTRGRGRGRGPWFTARRNPNWEDEKFDELEIVDDTLEEAYVTNNLQAYEDIPVQAYEDIPVQASGDNVPPPVKTFAEIDLGDGLKLNIRRCNYIKPTPIQRHAIPIAVAGRDLMACAQTGSGKTAAFCFPIISGVLKNTLLVARHGGGGGNAVACPLALILAPTRELSCQIYEEAKKFAYMTRVQIAVAYGGTSIYNQLRRLERGVDILVATPGRLVDMIERAKVSLKMIKYLALDEADRMLDMGFEPQIRRIVEQMDMPPPGTRQTMLFSATFPDEIQRFASDFLSDYVFLAVGRVGSSTDLIVQRVELVQEMDKRNHLLSLLRSQRSNGTPHSKVQLASSNLIGVLFCTMPSLDSYKHADKEILFNVLQHALTLVFVETKRRADELERWLSRNGFSAIAMHGDKVQMEREQALRSFKSGATPILVATDVASRGLDIPHVAHVINFDMPKNIVDYVHRIGRTGRAGKCGLATAFFSDKNFNLAKSLAEVMKESNQEAPTWLVQHAENYSASGGGGWVRRGGVDFGGYDLREDIASSSTYNDIYGVPAIDGHYDAVSVDAPTLLGSGDDDYLVASDMNHNAAAAPYGYGSIVASGWD
ncbi:DEAD-box ATP-dependent RNA helicase 37 [Hibiscus syriacus]|uniref:RNA helicase n=1 Tax=Hibiscus syriacus TaxID=106335 RepID=A0A6A2ZA07_HIBSY|nr:DEAD-box ATP-dependent RNA helicase 37 [Hibiscus syriacus]